MVSTDHNTNSSHGVWGQYAGPDLLIITGEEITTRNGHWVAMGLPAGRVDRLALPGQGQQRTARVCRADRLLGRLVQTTSQARRARIATRPPERWICSANRGSALSLAR